MENLTPQAALQILSDALQPQMQGQITRAGYMAIDKAIEVLASAINPKPQTDDLDPQS